MEALSRLSRLAESTGRIGPVKAAPDNDNSDSAGPRSATADSVGSDSASPHSAGSDGTISDSVASDSVSHDVATSGSDVPGSDVPGSDAPDNDNAQIEAVLGLSALSSETGRSEPMVLPAPLPEPVPLVQVERLEPLPREPLMLAPPAPVGLLPIAPPAANALVPAPAPPGPVVRTPDRSDKIDTIRELLRQLEEVAARDEAAASTEIVPAPPSAVVAFPATESPPVPAALAAAPRARTLSVALMSFGLGVAAAGVLVIAYPPLRQLMRGPEVQQRTAEPARVPVPVASRPSSAPAQVATAEKADARPRPEPEVTPPSLKAEPTQVARPAGVPRPAESHQDGAAPPMPTDKSVSASSPPAVAEPVPQTRPAPPPSRPPSPEIAARSPDERLPAAAPVSPVAPAVAEAKDKAAQPEATRPPSSSQDTPSAPSAQPRPAESAARIAQADTGARTSPPARIEPVELPAAVSTSAARAPVEAPATPGARAASTSSASPADPAGRQAQPVAVVEPVSSASKEPAAPPAASPVQTGSTSTVTSTAPAESLAARPVTAAPSAPAQPQAVTAAPPTSAAGNVRPQVPTEPRTTQPPTVASAPPVEPPPPRPAPTGTTDPSAPMLTLPDRLEMRQGERRALALRVTPRTQDTARLLVVLSDVPEWLSLSRGGTRSGAVREGVWLLPAHQVGDVAVEIAEGAVGTAEVKVQLASIDGRIVMERRVVVDVLAEPALPPVSLTATPPLVSEPMLSRLQAHVETLLDTGRVEEARKLLQTAAEAGNIAAALRLAETYDPLEMQRMGVLQHSADAVLAARWYLHAEALGSPVATDRLTALGRR